MATRIDSEKKRQIEDGKQAYLSVENVNSLILNNCAF